MTPMTPTADAPARQLRDWILTRPISFTTETDLQDGLAARFLAATPYPITAYGREVRLDPSNRIDFLVELDSTNIGVEVKIAGSLTEVTRQLTRYTALAAVDQLILVTTKASHHHVPREINGKPVILCSLIGDAL